MNCGVRCPGNVANVLLLSLSRYPPDYIDYIGRRQALEDALHRVVGAQAAVDAHVFLNCFMPPAKYTEGPRVRG